MNPSTHPFQKRLQEVRRLACVTSIGRALLKVGTWAAVFLPLYAFFDQIVSLSQNSLLLLSGSLAAALLIGIAVSIIQAFRIKLRDAALLADRCAGNPRSTILSACELSSVPQASTTAFETFLIHQNLDSADGELSRLNLKKSLVLPALAGPSRWFAVASMAAVVFFFLPGIPSKILLARILHPLRDTPPWSPYGFTVSPSRPEVHYGDTLELGVAITGAPLRDPVYLMTRGSHQTYRTACFQESPTRFLQRLENVTEPLEFCFSTGRARSQWQPVLLLLKPRISLARIRITPPAYCRLPPKDLIMTGGEISGQEGSRLELTITSNRPVSEGTLSLTPSSPSHRPPREVKGKKTGNHTLHFEWPLTESGRMEVRIRDIRGSLPADFLTASLTALPDSPPDVSVVEPAGFSLATPSSIIPLTLSASDDFGLKQVQLLRSIKGFRDRAVPLSVPSVEKNLQNQSPLNLGSLGVKPGQRLEFYMEASDNNPVHIGQSTSETIQVEIISEEEYAALLRNRTTLEEFQARYQMIAQQLKSLTESLEKLKSQSPGTPEYQKSLEESLQHSRALQELSSRLGSDFSAFDMEKELGPVLKEISQKTTEITGELSQAISNPSFRPDLDKMLSSLGASRKEMDRQTVQAEEVTRLARVMRHSANFNRILNTQQEIVRKLKRAAATRAPDHALLAAAHKLQKANEEALAGLLHDLPVDASALLDYEEYDGLRKSSLEFSTKLEESGALGHMKQAGLAAANQDEKKALDLASKAHDLLKSILGQCQDSGSEFGGLCEKKLSFKPKESLASTCRQMLQSLFSSGQGASGSGGGGEGSSEDGSFGEGNTSINMPVFGPQRTFFQGGSNQGKGHDGKGSGISSAIKTSPSESLPTDGSLEKTADIFPTERAPEKYRDAIRRYFDSNQKSIRSTSPP